MAVSEVQATTDGRTNAHEYTVSELSFALKRTIEDTYGHVRVRGEIGRVSRPGSGHVYLDLKDEKSVLAAVVWRGTTGRLKIAPEQGLEVVCSGRLTTFPGQSRYQIVIEHMEPAGVGALMALLEERRKKLAAEGLFNEEHKQELPFLPEVIGVVTSPTGAVIRDILHRLEDRFPRHVLLWPVLVQGEQAAEQIAAAIKGFNRIKPSGPVPRPDLLIVARGGGSIEDLWSFNEEIVVRAAFESKIPLISAVGHETDTTLIDFASDRRAPTPTAAAEMAVPVRSDLLSTVGDLHVRLGKGQSRLLRERRNELDGAARGLPRLDALLGLPSQRLDAATTRLASSLRLYVQTRQAAFAEVSKLSLGPINGQIERGCQRSAELGMRLTRALARHRETLTRRFETASKLLDSYSYTGVLDRGFVLVRGDDGRLIRRAKDADKDRSVELTFADGARRAQILNGRQAGRSQTTTARKKPKNTKASDDTGPQGRLF